MALCFVEIFLNICFEKEKDTGALKWFLSNTNSS